MSRKDLFYWAFTWLLIFAEIILSGMVIIFIAARFADLMHNVFDIDVFVSIHGISMYGIFSFFILPPLPIYLAIKSQPVLKKMFGYKTGLDKVTD